MSKAREEDTKIERVKESERERERERETKKWLLSLTLNAPLSNLKKKVWIDWKILFPLFNFFPSLSLSLYFLRLHFLSLVSSLSLSLSFYYFCLSFSHFSLFVWLLLQFLLFLVSLLLSLSLLTRNLFSWLNFHLFSASPQLFAFQKNFFFYGVHSFKTSLSFFLSHCSLWKGLAIKLPRKQKIFGTLRNFCLKHKESFEVSFPTFTNWCHNIEPISRITSWIFKNSWTDDATAIFFIFFLLPSFLLLVLQLHFRADWLPMIGAR